MVKIIFWVLKLSQYRAFATKLHSVGAEQGSCGQIPHRLCQLSTSRLRIGNLSTLFPAK